ncbi:unnamed protein product [Darwinula stevensoni]|uniref:Serine-threonine/tyrosine-protein kinase catalytic domain-containing protein n=1 Tax=Darwinula stevensoni TaxID=69355 RepID=A0A7R9AC09_9CRUS|nr:unnamed protein product [Darwinula stevensoni]CAG0899762.1 unnamed protein product [Darwinula stevensoni]
MMEFKIHKNTRPLKLPVEILGDLTLQSLWIGDTTVTSIQPALILPSEDRLVNFTLRDSRLKEFPFHIIQGLRSLQILWLRNNSLTSIPGLHSHSLEILDLAYNKIVAIEENGWHTPNLRELDIGFNPLSSLPSAVIKGLGKLEKFFCSGCNLGPTLLMGQMEFCSKTLKVVSLWENNISRLEPGALTGVNGETTVYLSRNNITLLEENAFRPILENMSLGDGLLYIECEIGRPDTSFTETAFIAAASLVVLLIVIIIIVCIFYNRLRKEQVRKIAFPKKDTERFRRGKPMNINPTVCLSEKADLLPYDKHWEFPAERLRLGDLMVILEYCRHGNLECFLRKYRSSFKNGIDHHTLNKFRIGKESLHFDAHRLPGGEHGQGMGTTIRKKVEISKEINLLVSFTYGDLVSWAYQISQGMEYLSSRKSCMLLPYAILNPAQGKMDDNDVQGKTCCKPEERKYSVVVEGITMILRDYHRSGSRMCSMNVFKRKYSDPFPNVIEF